MVQIYHRVNKYKFSLLKMRRKNYKLNKVKSAVEKG